MGDIVAFTPERVLDANGNPVSGAEARFYLSGTSTPAIVYSDSAETVPHPTPIVSNAAGVFPAAYRSGVALKVDVVDAGGGALPGYPIDPVRVTGVNSTQAAGISFVATEDIPANEVQTAIELVRASVSTPVTNVGLGIDGLAPELADFNATNTKSGHYRFTATTVGTRPATWSAGNVGTVSIYRHDSVNAVMVAVKTTTNETAQRVLTAGVWGAWSIILNSSLLQTTPNDFATGKVPLAEYAQPNTLGTLINSATNLNTLLTPGKYYFLAASRPTNLPSDYQTDTSGTVIVSMWGVGTAVMQEVQSAKLGGDLTTPMMAVWRRPAAAGMNEKWGRVYTQTSILGPVSQASGIPTGGLIERGNNGNGEYVKFADGTMICSHVITGITATAAAGALFQSASGNTWTFPAAFAALPVVTGAVPGGGAWTSLDSITTTDCAFRAMNYASMAARNVRMLAIGRWF